MRMIDADKLAAVLEDWEEKATDGTENDGTDGTTRIVYPVQTNTQEMLDLIANQPTLGSDCRYCGKVKTCKHVLGSPDTFTRINCPLWRPRK